MPLSRRETLAQALVHFRAADYQRAREVIASAQPSTPTEEAALHMLGDCVARLLKLPPQHKHAAPKFNESDPMSDDVVYFQAYNAWLDGELATAERFLRDHRAITPFYQAQFLIFRGWIFAKQGHLARQNSVTSQALRMLLDDPNADHYLLATASLALAALAREMPARPAHDILVQALDRIPKDEYPYQLMHVRRAIAQIEALHGRFPIALSHLTFATELAREPVDRAFLYFDYALIATWAKQHDAARAAYNVGLASVQSVDFAARNDESVFALTVGAIAGASIDPLTARSLAEQAEALIPKLSSRWAVAQGERAAALVDEAIALTTDDETIAAERGAHGGQVLEGLGYFWRAGRISAHLFQLTGHPGYRKRAERLLEFYSEGPLMPNDAPEYLPPRMRQILAMLHTGMNPQEIGAELGISKTTAQKHIARLHRRFRVSRRSQLLAKTSGLMASYSLSAVSVA